MIVIFIRICEKCKLWWLKTGIVCVEVWKVILEFTKTVDPLEGEGFFFHLVYHRKLNSIEPSKHRLC